MEEAASWVIRISIGLIMIIFGASQLMRPWLRYEPKWLHKLLPFPPAFFMRMHAFGNIGLGVFLASGLWPVVAAIAVIAWLAAIVPFALKEDVYVGLRDIGLVAAVVAELLLVW